MEDHPLLNTIDLEILMHKDAHFGGSFETMIDYYEQDGVGVQEEFDIDRIKELQAFDKEGHLSNEVLPEMAKSEVIFSKDLYTKFKNCYEQEDEILPHKIADLILSEEYHPEEEIKELAKFEDQAVKPLSEILLQDYFYNTLNPGYGRAPINAALCLKDLKNPDVVPFLFQALGKSFVVDEAILEAITSLGSHAEQFLADRLKAAPYTNDNYIAAMALASFPISDETAKLALYQLGKKETFKHESFVSYLICICEGLETEEDRNSFIQLSKSQNISKNLIDEMQLIISFWKNSA
ncbi:MAG: hypothetical protein S4CHLAM20_12750 [Chlamydiia bacterium]|nr:hypothetical protein [Chlamydiia bacterium]